MKRTVTILLTCIVIVLALALTAKHALTREQKPPVVQVAAAEVGGLQSDIMAQGTIVPVTSTDVSGLPESAGQVEQVFVRVGDRVVKGQPLARLDATDQAAQLAQSEEDATRYAAQYRLALHPYRPEEIDKQKATLDFDLHSADAARAQYEQLVHGSRPEQIAYAQAQVDSAQAALSQAQTQLQYDDKLFQKELIAKADHDKSVSAVDIARGGLAAARAQLDLAKAGSRPEQVSAAKAAYDAAESHYQEDLQTYRLMLAGSRPEQITEAYSDMQKANEAVREATNVLKRETVYAPISGVVTERNVEPGDVVTPSTTRSGSSPLTSPSKVLFVIADDSQVEFLANVDARFYPNVFTGQPATITFETDLGHTYQGTVARARPLINPLDTHQSPSGPTDPSDLPLTFDVWIRMPNADRKITLGEVGVATLTKQQSAGVLIPQGALTPFSSGNGEVYVEHDGVVSLRDVKYGDVIDGKVRVLSGVQDGDNVVVSTPFPLVDGMHVTPIPAKTGISTTPMN